MKIRKRIDLQKKVLLMTFLPWVAFLLAGSYYAIFGWNDGRSIEYGILGFQRGILAILESMIFDSKVVLLLGCIAYQMWYWLDRPKEACGMCMRRIFFVLSCICLGIFMFHGFCAAMFGTQRGLWSNGEKIYGIEAFLEAISFPGLLFCTVIPILPISFLYCVVYLYQILRKSKVRVNHKIIERIKLVLVIIISCILTVSIGLFVLTDGKKIARKHPFFESEPTQMLIVINVVQQK